MITNLILVGLGGCIGGAVAIILTSPNKESVNKTVKEAERELNIIEYKNIEIDNSKQIEIEEV